MQVIAYACSGLKSLFSFFGKKCCPCRDSKSEENKNLVSAAAVDEGKDAGIDSLGIDLGQAVDANYISMQKNNNMLP